MYKLLSLTLLSLSIFSTSTYAIVRPMSPAERDCAGKVDEQLKQRYGETAHLQFSNFKQQGKYKVLGSGKLVTDAKEFGLLKFTCRLDPQTEQVKRVIYQKLPK